MSKQLSIKTTKEPYVRKDFKFAVTGQEADIEAVVSLLRQFDDVVFETETISHCTFVTVAAEQYVFDSIEEDLRDQGYNFDD